MYKTCAKSKIKQISLCESYKNQQICIIFFWYLSGVVTTGKKILLSTESHLLYYFTKVLKRVNI